MSKDGSSAPGTVASERAPRRSLEGEERIDSLSAADYLAVTVGGEPGSPVVVFIGWSASLVEHAYPGTAIWRAALERFLLGAPTMDPANTLVRRAALESLAQFTSLERWLAWSDHERGASSASGARNAPTFWIGEP